MKTSFFFKSTFQFMGLLLLIGLASCQCDPEIMLNNTWVLEAYGPSGSTTEVMDPASATPPGTGVITLAFNDNNITGNDGCNSYFSSYTLDECNFSVGNINSTLILCSPEIMSQAGAYSTILRDVTTFRTKGNQLILCTADDRELIYRQQ